MSGLIRIAASRPVGVTVIYLAVALFGLVALRQLAVDLLPAVDVPRISITTQYEGVAPEEIETLLTRPIERATSTIEGIERIEAVSAEGLSRVQLQFTWGASLDRALDDVRVALDRVRPNLPEGAEPPSVFKFDLSAVPVAFLGLTGQEDPQRLTYLAQDSLSRALERVPGVASVDVQGGREREIRVALEQSRLTALGISTEQVTAALARENRNVSAGNMLDEGRQVVIRTVGELESVDEIGAVVVAVQEQTPVRVRDVARVLDTTRELRSELWIDGKPGIRMRVYKQSGSNTVEVVEQLRREIERINGDYRGRAQLDVLWDSSGFIRAAVTNVQSSAGYGALLALLVLLLFLRSLRAALVVATAIPLCVVATFGLMHFAGITLNIISFGGLALGIGMLVDASIVILESIHSQREAGLTGVEAAVKGAREVASAVVAGTLTTVAVFVPVVFVGGFAGVFFEEMALVVTFSLLCSLAVALTLVPMLAARLLSSPASTRGVARTISDRLASAQAALDRGYARLLSAALVAPWAIVAGACAVLLSSVAFATQVGVELLPEADEGRIDVDIELPVGTPIEQTMVTMQEIERRVLGALRPGELEHTITSAGPESWWQPSGSNKGEVDLTLVPVQRRERGIEQVMEEIRRSIADVPGIEPRIRATSSNALTRIVRRGEERLSVEVRGHDLGTAAALAEQVIAQMKQVPGVTFARPDREVGQPERVLRVDRQRAAELGLGSADIAETVEHYVLGRVATRYRERGDEFDVRVQLSESESERLEQLAALPIVTPTGDQVPLGTLVEIEERTGPSAISRVDQERTLRIDGGTEGRPLGDIAADVDARLARLQVPEGFTVALSGELAEQGDTFTSLVLGIVLACFLVFAAMAVQFESARHPLVVMSSVPFAAIGVIAALWSTGTTFNMNSFLGVIVLVGIVVNNAIVLVDYTNLLRREQGMELREALVAAGTRRLRPIVMTTLTTLLALLPLALGTAEGSEIQAPLARAVVGGLLTSTLVTLLLVPAAYLLVERRSPGRHPGIVYPSALEPGPRES